jgi:4-amino-4-deoxy-L-arabinose transferase-like glycosyltransferase
VTSPSGGNTVGGGVRPAWIWTAVLAAAIWCLGLTYPLLESTEGRYASVAAEMVWSGNWMDPAFNGNPHFTKPPLAYWFGGLGIALLGRNAFAVRLPATAALVLCVFLVWRLGRSLGLGRTGSAGAAALALLSPLAVAQGRITSSDIFLWIGVLVFYLGLAGSTGAGTAGAGLPNARAGSVTGNTTGEATSSSRLGRRRIRDDLLVGFGLGWGFLAKGPPVLLWTVLPVIGLAAVRRIRGKRDPVWHLSRLGSPAGLVLALAVGLPWYVIEAVRHPGLVSYWLGSETADRFLTTAHGRSEPFWYFALLLPGVALPWLPEVVRGIRRAARAAGPWILVFLWILLPVIVLSMSGSKRPNYLLPAVAPLALLAGLAVETGMPRRLRIRLGIWAALVLLYPALLFLDPVAPPTRTLAAAIRDSGRPALLYRTLPSSLPFYLGRAVPMLGGRHPHPFGRDDEVPPPGAPEPEAGAASNPETSDLLQRAASGTCVVLLRTGDTARLEKVLEAAGAAPGTLTVLKRARRYALARRVPES